MNEEMALDRFANKRQPAGRRRTTCNRTLSNFRRSFWILLLCGAAAGSLLAQSHSQISGDQTRILINQQAGSSYTLQQSDCGKLVTFNSGSPVAVTLPPPGLQIVPGCWIEVQNTGAGLVTITSTSSTIDGGANVQLAGGAGLKLIAGVNQFYSQRGQGAAGGAGGGVSSSAKSSLAFYPSSGSMVMGSGCLVAGTSNSDLTCASITTNGLAQGEIDLYPDPTSTTYVGLVAPYAVPSTYTLQLPSAAPVNQVLSFTSPANGTAYGSWVDAMILAGIGSASLLPPASATTGLYYLATDSSDCATVGGSTNTLCRSTGSAWVPIGGGGGGSANGLSGASNLVTTGAVPFENGSAGTITQDAGFTYDSTGHRLNAGTSSDSVTVGTLVSGYSGLWNRASSPSASNYSILGDGASTYFNAPSGAMFFRIGNSDIMRINSGSTTLQIPGIAAHSGTRYVCVDTAGTIVSQVTPCSGT